MTAHQLTRARWHLDAPRQITDCGCLWVIPRTGSRFRAFWCMGHRWSRGEALQKARGAR